MKKRNFREQKSVKRWFSHVYSSGIRSAATEKNYLSVLRKFCKYAKKTPDQLTEERRMHMKSGDELTMRQHEELVRDWMNYMETERGLARGTVSTAIAIIKSFYSANYYPLIVKAPKSWPTRARKVPTRDELKLMMESCSKVRDQTIIMMLAQTGVSLGDFLELITYEKIRGELENGIEPLHLSMDRTKIAPTFHYDTFLGVDGLEYLNTYLKTVTVKLNRPIFNLTSRSVEYIVKDASVRADLKPAVTPHKLRSFFNTMMSLSFHGAHSNHIPIVEYWMGHVMPYKGAYMVPPVDDTLRAGTEEELSQRKLYRDHEWAVSIS